MKITPANKKKMPSGVTSCNFYQVELDWHGARCAWACDGGTIEMWNGVLQDPELEQIRQMAE